VSDTEIDAHVHVSTCSLYVSARVSMCCAHCGVCLGCGLHGKGLCLPVGLEEVDPEERDGLRTVGTEKAASHPSSPPTPTPVTSPAKDIQTPRTGHGPDLTKQGRTA
jgi:hypothetical protein